MNHIKSMIKKYWDWRSRSYGLDKDKSIQAEEKWKTAMAELVHIDTSGKRALDIGTGTGQFAFYLAGFGFDVTGIDLSDNMIERAREKASRWNLNIDFRTGDAEHLDFEDNAFDVVVSRNLLWTLPNPEKAMEEWHRVLKPDGRIIVSDGFWQNDTWNRIHLLGEKLLKGVFQRTGSMPLRFFTHYSALQKKLPYYEGIHFSDADRLMRKALFRDIRCYDVRRFERNPYGEGKSFFIAYAGK